MKVMLEPGAYMPERAHKEDAGLDLRVPNGGQGFFVVPARSRVVIDTGVHVQIPKDCGGFLRSKSGLMLKHGILTDGTVDEGYTGSVKVIVFNTSANDHTFYPGDKISQLVIEKVEKPSLIQVDHLEETDRGSAGLGSAGIK